MGTTIGLPVRVRVLRTFLSLLLPLLLCVSPAAGTGKYTAQSTSLPPTSPRPHCWYPEECCDYPFDSDEFDKCCKEHGCCPISCPVTEPGGDIVPTKECHAWECCTHLEGSPKHQQCCRRHGCCPPCERVSSGCCYNGMRYAFRTLVVDLPEVCLQLVCAARLLPIPPYFVATITPVKTCSFDDMSKFCVGCPVHHCVDEFGLVRMEGDVWSPSPCVQCECRQGHLLCRSFLSVCSPKPHPGCITIPGPCCPTYHCDEGCFDEAGVFRPVGSQWPSSDPCQIMTCTEDGVDTVDIVCKPPKPPHEGCILLPVKGKCCPEWNCSRCLDDDGTFHPLHDEWQAGPCIVKVCTTTGIVERPVLCPTLGPAPHDTCFRYVMEDNCCEEWKCNGCWEGDVLHLPGSHWSSDDPCFYNECTNDVIVLRPIDCPIFPRPHESCFEAIPEGACCATWNCSGCVDEDGTYHPLYEEWQIDQCTTAVCHLNGISIKHIHCLPLGPAPHVTCHKGLDDGGCCEEWECKGCFDDAGVFHPPGSQWPSSEPCDFFVCLPSGVIDIITIICDHAPPPHDGCFLQKVEGQCCRVWNCSGCWDSEGTFRKLNVQWTSPNDSCTFHICTLIGIETHHSQELCLPPPKPHPHCKLVFLPGECCPTWDCSSRGCLDEYGIRHPNGSEWTSEDSCVVFRCIEGEVSRSAMECSEPPLPICFPTFQEDQCCPTWNCSGCMDDDGVFRNLGESWTTYLCTSHNCTSQGILKSPVSCPDPPGPHCVPEDPQPLDACCTVWRCEDPLYVGIRRGSTTPDTPVCAGVECHGPPWNANCKADTLPGQCCPAFSCLPPQPHPFKPECANFYCRGPPLNARCTAHVSPHHCCPSFSCSLSNVTLRPDCSAVLCFAPPPNMNCTITTPPGECCPVQDCDTATAPPQTTTTTTTTTATSPSNTTTTAPPPSSTSPQPNGDGSSCTDENGQPREEGEMWISSDDGCTKSQCHKGMVIFHYQC